MDKILAGIAVLGVALGAFFLSRNARASTVSAPTEPANIGPGVGGIEPVPLGSSGRGIRNNNPFNIEFRTSIQWRGQVGTDGRFTIFDTPLNGLRAGMINIHTKFTRDGINTVRGLLTVLSPAHENPLEAYVTYVSNRLSVAPEQPLDWRAVILPLSKAIVFFENGQNPYPDSLYQQALQETGKQ